MWQAALIVGATQARKTHKTFDVLTERLNKDGDNLVLFVTQSNSTTSAYQLIGRARQHSQIIGHIPPTNITRTGGFSEDVLGNVMVVDFYNTKNTTKMLSIACTYHWTEIIVVFDECDQGGTQGTFQRLKFLHQVEQHAGTKISVIFVTATAANLSNSLYKICNQDMFKSSIVQKIIRDPITAHYHVIPCLSLIHI